MYRKLILIGLFLSIGSCRRVSSDLLYHEDLRYKHLFTYDGTGYGHVLFVENWKNGNKPTQDQLEELSEYYTLKNNAKGKKIDYIKYVKNEFTCKDEIDQYSISTIYIIYINNEIVEKKYYGYPD